MKLLLWTLLTVCYAATVGRATMLPDPSQPVEDSSQLRPPDENPSQPVENPSQPVENPSHASLRDYLRAALDPARLEALEEAVDTAAVGGADNRLVQKLLSLSYAEFGSRARVHNFNRLVGNSTVKFLPRMLSLLSIDARHEADLREAAFTPPAAGAAAAPGWVGVWRLHKFVHAPRVQHNRDGGTRLSCMLVHPTATGSFDILIVISANAQASIGDADLLISESKLGEQMGWAERREGRLARMGGEVGLTEADVSALMTFAELNCLRKIGAYFHIAYDQ